MLDKIFLFIFGIEWFGFGILGLFFPEIISNLIGISQTSDIYINETRAWYSFFTILGLMSLFSIYRVRLRKKVYLTFSILMGSFLVGRSISFFLDNSFGTGTALIFANELIVFVIAYWRYTKRDFIF
ncbi:MAG: hypothetical protein CM15mP123_09920 [Gammaproteobacteria bacterium]|nr:MAG: hypothetical protein CM15mP123_09920 [Gammaproteobacteria bacterium]|tara:strand:- start:1757 stop:2137 length:381 start_codon:yes stop_codon:yes gene_type:complete